MYHPCSRCHQKCDFCFCSFSVSFLFCNLVTHVSRSVGRAGSGQIEPAELRKVLESCLGESAISLPNDKLEALTSALFEAADKDGDGAITLEELSEELGKHPQVLDDLTISPVSWLKPTPVLSSHRPIARTLSRTYWQNNGGKFFFLAAFVAANSGMFATAYRAHRTRGPWIAVARGCGLCLHFNCVFVVVLMLRRCITLLRTSRAASFIPFEQHVFFHQLVGVVIFILASVHSACHTVNFVILSKKENATYSFWDYLLSVRPGLGWVAGSASITGVVLQLLLCIMVMFSSPCVRRNGHFELFYWTHLCYVWFWLLLVVHASQFWKWLLVPGLLFLIEKITGLVRLRAGCTRITAFSIFPSGVTHLIIERPPRFQFKAGDYIYLNIPAIARFEWHPFTISSAPEQLDTLWLHIRSQGQWTTRLSDYVRELYTNSLTDTSRHPLGVSRAARTWPNQENIFSISLNRDSTSNWDQGDVRMTSYKIHHDSELPGSRGNAGECNLDGPYGTQTRRIFLAEHAVLIGAGIGITPFASILQSIMVRYNVRKQNCPSCSHSWLESMEDQDMNLRKVDFMWINRDQRSFEWFVDLLMKLEREQADQEFGGRFLDMHLYMTSALGRNDLKALGLQMALDILAQKENCDSITGLRTRTQPGRPDWKKVFKKISSENKGNVQVFFCGSPALSRIVKSHCERYGFKFFKENF